MSEKDQVNKLLKTLHGRPALVNEAIVNHLRHLRMDPMSFNASDNDEYLRVYKEVMQGISTDYPFLSREVERQIAKKIRWQSRRRTCQDQKTVCQA